MKKILFIFLFILPLFCFSQEEHVSTMLIKKDSFNIYFPINSSSINKNYLNNYTTLKRLNDLLLVVKASNIDSIIIYSYSSFDGSLKYNNKLSKRRANSVKNYFDIKYSHIPLSKVFSFPKGENWIGFKHIIEKDNEIPSKKLIIHIINCNSKPDIKERKIKKLNNGKSYKYIVKNIFPYLRNTSTTFVYYKKKNVIFDNIDQSNGANDISKINSKTDPIKDSSSDEHLLKNISQKQDTLSIDNINNSIDSLDTKNNIGNKDSIIYSPLIDTNKTSSCNSLVFAIKNNFLYDLLLAPNIEIECQIKNWSINLEYQFPWYVNNSKHLCYQVLLGGLEGRYWFYKKAEHKPLTGFFIGAYVGAGIFDLQNGEEGTQGNINFLTGISGGYSKSISKNFNLEFSLGLGFFNSNNINYYAYEELLIKKNDSKFSYFGLTKAKVSLVWIINNKKY